MGEAAAVDDFSLSHEVLGNVEASLIWNTVRYVEELHAATRRFDLRSLAEQKQIYMDSLETWRKARDLYVDELEEAYLSLNEPEVEQWLYMQITTYKGAEMPPSRAYESTLGDAYAKALVSLKVLIAWVA
tara:strand:- start:208 stop:597 length:390 start_codon:yes stop_codon:yes gene_type:complete